MIILSSSVMHSMTERVDSSFLLLRVKYLRTTINEDVDDIDKKVVILWCGIYGVNICCASHLNPKGII